jgi:hypothetical protein
MPDAASVARSVYKPRRPQASPRFRLVSDHRHRLQTVYDDRFVRENGRQRPVVTQVAGKFLGCGVLDHGFARIRCDACTHEYLLAFSCKCRYVCPSGAAQAPRDLDAVAGHHGAREVDDRAVDSASRQPTPIEIPIPAAVLSEDRSWDLARSMC